MKNNNKKYSFLASNKFCLDEYCLVPFMEQEMELIRKWRNEQIDYLRQNKPLTKDEQSKYYHQIIKKSFSEQLYWIWWICSHRLEFKKSRIIICT